MLRVQIREGKFFKHTSVQYEFCVVPVATYPILLQKRGFESSAAVCFWSRVEKRIRSRFTQHGTDRRLDPNRSRVPGTRLDWVPFTKAPVVSHSMGLKRGIWNPRTR